MAARIIFIFCENYAEEARNALALEVAEGAMVATFPPRCGRPAVTPEDIAVIIEPLGDVKHVEIFGACCLNKLSDYAANGCNVHVHKLEHCFSLIADPELINDCLQKGAYLTTPGWLANWAANLERLGLDRETGRDMFAETTVCIALLDTGVDKQSAENLQMFADYVARPHETFRTGISILRLLIAKIFQARQYEEQITRIAGNYSDLQKQASMHAMSIELLTNLARIVDLEHAIEGMMDVYAMLFAPQKINYLSFERGIPDKLWTRPPCNDEDELAVIKSRLASVGQESAYTESGRGFVLRIVHREMTTGVIEIDEVAFPENIGQYLNQALGIVNISALPILNARKYQRLIEAEDKLRKANQQLVLLATTDALTGLANRRSYDECIEREWKRMLREHTALSLIVCDIDYFKRFNDHYGHGEGDLCLKRVAQAIHSQAMRPGDVVTRYGGEEFVVILPDTPIDGAFHIAEKIRMAVAGQAIPHEYSETAPYVTISLGVSQVMPQVAHGMSISDLFHAADAALYEAKKQGRNRSVMHEAGLPGNQ